jgi:putative transposase
MKPPIRQRKPNRMPKYDYSSRGCYFVTICSKNKEINSFGKIANGNMELSHMGKIAEKCWLEIPIHFPNIRLDEFVIIPNHVHGIIAILSETGDSNIHSQLSYPITDRSKMYLSKIIQAFKASVTRQTNQDQRNEYFAWQKSFYDHIIHTQKELFQMRKYISENPINYSEELFSEIINM